MGSIGRIRNSRDSRETTFLRISSVPVLTYQKDMDYLCYTVEESKFVRGNPDAQRMIIETMKRKLCGRSDEKDQPRRSTLGKISRVNCRREHYMYLGYLLCVGGLDSSKGCNTIEVFDPLFPKSWEQSGSIQVNIVYES